MTHASVRGHRITFDFEPDGSGGERIVCRTCRRRVGYVAFEATEPIMVEGRELGRTRVIRGFDVHYGSPE